MTVELVEAKTLLKRHRCVDSWFVSRYGMNLYRGCTHDCAYCDGRAEGYHTAGVFGRDVQVKTNAAALLRKELDPKRRRKPLRHGFILLGGGVNDSHQPLDGKHQLARLALEEIVRHPFGVHVLTKSASVLRDVDLLRAIDTRKRAVVSMSFSTVDDAIAERFEPGCSRPSERLAALKRLRAEGLHTGAFLMPVIPGVSDSQEAINVSMAALADAGVGFVVFGGMTIKDGRQREHFLAALAEYDPQLAAKVDGYYGRSKWGQAPNHYYEVLDGRFGAAARAVGLPARIPPAIYGPCLDDDDQAAVMLEHLDYLGRFEGRRPRFGLDVRALQGFETAPFALARQLDELKLSPEARELVAELLETGHCERYDRALAWA